MAALSDFYPVQSQQESINPVGGVVNTDGQNVQQMPYGKTTTATTNIMGLAVIVIATLALFHFLAEERE